MPEPRPSVLQTCRQLAFRLARPDILFWTLPLLMILLIVGTVAQKELGLYAAQETYFSSLFVWLGPIPFPGGLTLMGIFFVNLLAKFLIFSEWQWRKAGIILAHFGTLLLFIGGGFTALTQQEGYLIIPEGGTSAIIEDYHQRELRILKDDQVVFSLPFEALAEGQSVPHTPLPWTLHIETACASCTIVRRTESEQDNWTTPGRFMQLQPGPRAPQDEENIAGIEFSLNGLKYVTFDAFPKPPRIEHEGHTYTIIIGRAQRPLPFSLRLEKFSRQSHPGTQMASAFRSDVTVLDGEATWPARISMNEPLRYQSYTFYQSSFDESGETPRTVLSVVRNSGRYFPYAASIIIGLGLALHLFLSLRQRRSP